MITRLRKPLTIVIALALIGALVWISFGAKKQTATGQSGEKDEPFGRLEKFVYTRTVGGETEWELRAKEARYFPEREEVELDDIDGRIETKARRIEVQGEHGKIHLTKRTGDLAGNVVGRTDDGYILRTTRLEFDANSNRGGTDDPVMIEGKNLTLQGVGMDLDLEKQTFVLREQVKASFRQEGHL